MRVGWLLNEGTGGYGMNVATERGYGWIRNECGY